jgi:hypothetical protein
MRFARLSPRRLLAGAILTLLAASAAPASATLLVYEPFDYPTGVIEGAAASGLNLTGSYASGSPLLRLEVASPGLDYGSLAGAPAAAANRLTQTTGTAANTATVAVDSDVLVGPGETIFWSALFTFDDSSNGNRLAHITFTDDSNGDAITFGEATVGIGAIRVSASTAATGGLVAAGADGAFVDGHTLLLIGRYFNSAAAGSDTLDLLVYDTADAEPIPASFDLLDPNAEHAFSLAPRDIDLAAIGSITFAIRGDANNFVDELRIGDSYGSVVPEPGAGLLLTTGLLGLAACGRRRGSLAQGGSGRPRAARNSGS